MTLFIPTLLAILACLVMRLLPFNTWSRFFVSAILVFFMARYTTWRINSTINFDSAYLFIYSLMYFFFELIDLIVFFGGRVTSIFSTKIENSKTADALRQGLLGKENFPLVDILVPTCGEPIFTLRRTILCCSILNYPNKKIYILDDSNRPEIKELSFEFQCEYIARKDRKHAKAGNLNNALTQINGEFIAVMDADFAPFKDFLDRSIGFFEDKSIGLVQSSQGFYNSDCYLRGLGVENLFPSDLAYFFDIDLSCRDFWGTAACCGTSYVVRRSALDAIGGYVTKCINEDTPTSVKMEINGFNVVYLNEILSVGESPRTYPDFVGQRCRWHLGDYQICLSTDDILIWHKLSFSQIIYYLCWYLKSFLPISRLFSLIALLVFAAFGISPISSSLNNFIYFWLPWITIYVFSYRWISGQRSSYIFRELYNTLLIFPLLICQIRALIKPFGHPFRITRKAVKIDKKNLNLALTYPLLIISIAIVLVIISLWFNQSLENYSLLFQEKVVLTIFLAWQGFLTTTACVAATDIPERRFADRFPFEIECNVEIQSCGSDFHSTVKSYCGTSVNISQTGLLIALSETLDVCVGTIAYISLKNFDVKLKSRICRTALSQDKFCLAFDFIELSQEQEYRLIELLYADGRKFLLRKNISFGF